ncbi:MAG: type II toxin-antitoxin system ParD family antitoxin [Alphaproteobacteria bacterium]|nr:type II toxin-antitoxin system ParD family antitoxin [Alphaproteobacteria bacterium]
MNVSLTPELEKFVRDRVASGLYNNASEVVREALRLLHQAAGQRRAPDRTTVEKAIRRIETDLRAKGIDALYLFGSVARGEAKPGSDIDVLIEVAPDSRFSLLDQAGIQADLSNAVGHAVDVIVKKSLRKELRNQVLAEAKRVF